MDAETILMISLFAIPAIALMVYAITNRPKTLSGPATLEAHRIEYSKIGSQWSRGWNHILVFRLADGELLELRAVQADYEAAVDGQQGTLFWDGNLLVEFIPNQA